MIAVSDTSPLTNLAQIGRFDLLTEIFEEILIDEIAARESARRYGLRISGVVGVLLESKNRRLISAVGPELEALRSRANFYLAEAFVQRVLEQAGEA